jgi:hypothetical protein
MEAKVQGVGRFSAVLSAMTVDMVGHTGIFGRLNLPKVKVKNGVADVAITDQVIQIVDMENFKAFVKALIQDEELVLRFENGKGTIRFMLMTLNVTYTKEVRLKGMNGPKTIITKTELDREGFKNTMLILNPSPVEIDMGLVYYEIRNEEAVKIAKQWGSTYITRGESTSRLTGKTTGGNPKGEARLVAIDVEDDNWHKETIKYLDMSITLSEEFSTICSQ